MEYFSSLLFLHVSVVLHTSFRFSLVWENDGLHQVLQQVPHVNFMRRRLLRPVSITDFFRLTVQIAASIDQWESLILVSKLIFGLNEDGGRMENVWRGF